MYLQLPKVCPGFQLKTWCTSTCEWDTPEYMIGTQHQWRRAAETWVDGQKTLNYYCQDSADPSKTSVESSLRCRSIPRCSASWRFNPVDTRPTLSHPWEILQPNAKSSPIDDLVLSRHPLDWVGSGNSTKRLFVCVSSLWSSQTWLPHVITPEVVSTLTLGLRQVHFLNNGWWLSDAFSTQNCQIFYCS